MLTHIELYIYLNTYVHRLFLNTFICMLNSINIRRIYVTGTRDNSRDYFPGLFPGKKRIMHHRGSHKLAIVLNLAGRVADWTAPRPMGRPGLCDDQYRGREIHEVNEGGDETLSCACFCAFYMFLYLFYTFACVYVYLCLFHMFFVC